MLNDIRDYYRFRIYENCRILVNDMRDVIKELQLFLDNKIYPYLNENGGRIVVEDIEILNEGEKIVWRIIERNEINDIKTVYIDKFNILDIFKEKEEYIKEVKESMENFPKELYGLSFISFMETMYKFVFSDELINDIINVFDICMVSDNGTNNVIYECQ